jgi:transcriptional regulator with XRE-family HTH domain
MGSSRPSTAGLAEKLFLIRSRLGLTQAQMVELLKSQRLPGLLRVYAGNISRFEQGQREPSLLALLAYARAVGVTVEVLIDAELKLPDKLVPYLANEAKRQCHAAVDLKRRGQKGKGSKKVKA